MRAPRWVRKNQRAREIGGEAIEDVMQGEGPITGRRVLKALFRAAINVLLGRAARKV
jgi:hypothetical protein